MEFEFRVTNSSWVSRVVFDNDVLTVVKINENGAVRPIHVKCTKEEAQTVLEAKEDGQSIGRAVNPFLQRARFNPEFQVTF